MDDVPDDKRTMTRLSTSSRSLALAAIMTAPLSSALAAGDLGFRIGEAGRLHLSLEVAGSYDSNIFYATTGEPVSGYALDIIPGFELKVPGNTVSLALKGALDRRQYLTTEAEILSRFFGNAELGVAVNREGALALELTDAFAYSDQSPSLSLAQAVISNLNDLKVAVPYRPGGGALALTLSGQWVRETFEQYGAVSLCNPADNSTCQADITSFGYDQFGGGLQVRWRFLPRTAVLLEGTYFQRLPQHTTVSREVRGLNVEAGLAGLVTSRVAVTLKGGWGTAFDSIGSDWSTWLAMAELEYVTQGPLGAKVGYLHGFHADPGTTYSLYESNRAYSEGKVLLAGRFTLRANLAWERQDYVLNNVQSDLFTVSPAVDVELMRWIYVGASYSLLSRSSSLGQAVPAFDYTRHLATLRLVGRY